MWENRATKPEKRPVKRKRRRRAQAVGRGGDGETRERFRRRVDDKNRRDDGGGKSAVSRRGGLPGVVAVGRRGVFNDEFKVVSLSVFLRDGTGGTVKR